jgi:hypothetical protein
MFKIQPAQLIEMVDRTLKKQFGVGILNPDQTIQRTLRVVDIPLKQSLADSLEIEEQLRQIAQMEGSNQDEVWNSALDESLDSDSSSDRPADQ